MHSFTNDYSEGAHPRILEALMETNLTQHTGYGMDEEHCGHARELIRREIGRPDASVHFLVGGTQANLTVIAAALKPWEAVICASTGHINVHETGAVEATGHKVLTLPDPDGKVTPAMVLEILDSHPDEHMVKPKMVYISNTTEIGTQYTKAELEALSHLCRQRGLYLFLDGARLGAALASSANDLTLADIAALTDVFYIGGTKNGALFGEAVVILNPQIDQDFRYMIKQRGGMLAKGRLLGLQFDALFTDDLYFQLGRHANELAMRLKDAFLEKGYELCYDSYTNQQFPILPKEHIEKLRENYAFGGWDETDDDRRAVRFCTSWATTEEAVDQLIRDIREL